MTRFFLFYWRCHNSTLSIFLVYRRGGETPSPICFYSNMGPRSFPASVVDYLCGKNFLNYATTPFSKISLRIIYIAQRTETPKDSPKLARVSIKRAELFTRSSSKRIRPLSKRRTMQEPPKEKYPFSSPFFTKLRDTYV